MRCVLLSESLKIKSRVGLLVLVWCTFAAIAQRFEQACNPIPGLQRLFNDSKFPPPPSYLVLGTNDAKTIGIGNALTFFPAAYYFSLFTERRIVIYDDSLLGQFCRVYRCRYPLVSEIRPLYPDLFNEYNMHHMRILTSKDYKEIFDGRRPLYDYEPLVTSTGIESKSEWFAYFDPLMLCVARMTGCVAGDVSCAERHAYQSLLVGPLQFATPAQQNSILSRVHGLSNEVVRQWLTSLTREYAPRFDVSLHIRNQFNTLEKNMTAHERQTSKESAEWIAGDEYTELLKRLQEDIPQFVAAQGRNVTADMPCTIFLSTDDPAVKRVLVHNLTAFYQARSFPVRIVYTHSDVIVHAKHQLIEDVTTMSSSESFILTVIDWYAISLSNVLLAYRRGNSRRGLSTFAVSAARVSGTRARTDTDNRAAGSVGTEAFVYHRNRGYQLVLGRFWMFPNFDPPS